MVALNDIREKLARYLADEIPLAEFEDWFVQSTWDVRKQENQELREAVHSIELRLSEFSSGHLTEQALRKELKPFVTSVNTVIHYNVGVVQPLAQPLDVKWLPMGRVLFAAPAGRESGVVSSSVEFVQ